MIFDFKYAGKWVASKGNSVIDSALTLKTLTNKLKDRKDSTKLIYTRIPIGLIACSV